MRRPSRPAVRLSPFGAPCGACLGAESEASPRQVSQAAARGSQTRRGRVASPPAGVRTLSLPGGLLRPSRPPSPGGARAFPVSIRLALDRRCPKQPPYRNTGVMSGVRRWAEGESVSRETVGGYLFTTLGDVPRPVMWTAGIDYLRLTRRPGDGLLDTCTRWAMMAIRCQKLTGVEVTGEPWAFLGYYGQRHGKVAYGSSRQGGILQASGHTAHELWALRPEWDACPRLDVQVTLWYEQGHATMPTRAARASLAARDGAKGRPWQVREVRGHGAGDTTYLGARTSDTFVRIYDKEAESGDPGYQGAVRYEVEYKGAAALRALASVELQDAPPAWWYGLVRDELVRRGIRLPPEAGPSYVPAPAEPPALDETARRLAWLAGSVSQTVEKLLAAGVPRQQVVDALGLGEYNARARAEARAEETAELSEAFRRRHYAA